MANPCPKCHTDNPPDSKFCKECAAPLVPGEAEKPGMPTRTLETSREELTTGSTFAGRYQIIEELGSGGMGRVYKVFDTEIREKLALKLISPELAADENTILRFRNELKLARAVSHPHVCRMYDLNREAGTYFITMEYVAGEDLKNMIRMSKQLAVGTAVCIARQICEGLSAAHAKGIVHRDLKPNNIMMDRNGFVRIMDFGIARSPKSKGITGRGTMIGTPEYMSPEQVEGKDVDHRSDIYSLGITLYEMLTGRLPFEGDTALSVGIKQKTEPPEDPVKFNHRIPAALSALILKCLEKSREDRYQGAAEIEAELARIEDAHSTAEKPRLLRKPATSKTITVQFTLKKIWIPALVLIAVLAAGFLLLKSRPRLSGIIPPSDKPSLAVVYFENNSGNPNLDHWRSGLCELLITDLSQSRYLHVLGGDKIYTMLEEMNLLEASKFNTTDLQNIASKGGANHILRGNYITAGNKFIINIALLDAKSGKVIHSLREEAAGEENITTSVDRITKAVKTALEFTPRQMETDIDKDVGIVTTRSPEAYKLYVEGIRHDIRGDYPKVIEAMKKAVAIDPQFASAYYVMAYAYGNQDLQKEENDNIKKALDLSEHLSEREKCLIEGNYYLIVERNNVKAERIFKKLVKLYPDDIAGHNMLGVAYARMGDEEKRNHHYAKAIELGTQDVVVYTNLAASYNVSGLYEKSREVLESYIRKFGDSARIRRYLAMSYHREGRYAEARAELDRAQILSPDDMDTRYDLAELSFYTEEWEKIEAIAGGMTEHTDTIAPTSGLYILYKLRQLQGRYKEMEELWRKGLQEAEKNGQKAWKRTWLHQQAYIEERLGRTERALALFNQVIDLALEDNLNATAIMAMYGRGLVSLRRNNPEAALRTAEEIGRKIETDRLSPHYRYLSHLLLGRIAREKKDYDAAYEAMEKGRSLLSAGQSSHITFAYELGMTAYLAGDRERAREEFTRLIHLSVGRMDFGDGYAKTYYMLGKIEQELGNSEKAGEHYKKFLTLWKNADPGLPELDDAKARRASLR